MRKFIPELIVLAICIALFNFAPEALVWVIVIAMVATAVVGVAVTLAHPPLLPIGQLSIFTNRLVSFVKLVSM